MHNLCHKLNYLAFCFWEFLSVGALESIGVLFKFADIKFSFPNTDIVVLLLGSASAIIDNVPLVAASGNVLSRNKQPFMAFYSFSAGTGGSMLIIGSAAGVVAMGMEKIDFFGILKKYSCNWIFVRIIYIYIT